MSVLATRFLYGIPILGGVVGLLLWDQSSGGFTGIGILAALFGSGAIFEFARMNRVGRPLEIAAVLWLLGLLGARALSLSGKIGPESGATLEGVEILLLALAPGTLVLLGRRLEPSAEPLRRIAIAVLGLIYVGLPLVCLLELGVTTEWGLGWLLFLVLVVKGNDSGAYLVGRKWGKTPLSPISPKKTREGSIGGLALGTAIAVAIVALDPSSPLGYPGALGVALGVGILGQLGDLVESYLKRCAGVKDSGALIPAFGGVLDLLDSLLLAGPALLAVARIWEGTWNI